MIVFIGKLNPRTYTQSHDPHSGTRKGGDGTLPGVFDMLQYIETILPLVESL